MDLTDRGMMDWLERVKPIIFRPLFDGDTWTLCMDADNPEGNEHEGMTLRQAVELAMRAKFLPEYNTEKP